MFEKKQKPNTGEEIKQEESPNEDKKPSPVSGLFGLKKLFDRKKTLASSDQSKTEKIVPASTDPSQSEPPAADIATSSDPIVVSDPPVTEAAALESDPVPIQPDSIDIAVPESPDEGATLTTPPEETPPPGDVQEFYIPNAPANGDKQSVDVPADGSPADIQNVESEELAAKQDEPSPPDTRSEEILATIEKNLKAEKPVKIPKVKKQDALVDEIIAAAATAEISPEPTAGDPVLVETFLDPEPELLLLSDPTEQAGNDSPPSPQPNEQKNTESVLFAGIEEELQKESEAIVTASSIAISEQSIKEPEKAGFLKARLLKWFPRKDPGAAAHLSSLSSKIAAKADTPAPTVSGQNDTSIAPDPADALLNPTPEPVLLNEISSSPPNNEAPERNVVALFKSVGLSKNDIPASARGELADASGSGDTASTPDAAKDAEKAEVKNNELVSAIIETAKKSQEERNKVLGGEFTDSVNVEEEEVQKKKLRHERLLIISRFFAGFSLLIPLCSWIVFQAVLDGESKFSSLLKAENHGAIHAALLTKKTEKESQLSLVTKEINSIQEKTNNIRDNKILKSIIDNRIDFLEIMLGVNKTTLKSLNLTPELNNAIHMLVFNSFTGQLTGTGAGITISGTVRDPKRLSMSKLTYLIESINGDDHLEGVQLRTFAKSVDELGGTQSSFNFNFQYSPDTAVAQKDSKISKK